MATLKTKRKEPTRKTVDVARGKQIVRPFNSGSRVSYVIKGSDATSSRWMHKREEDGKNLEMVSRNFPFTPRESSRKRSSTLEFNQPRLLSPRNDSKRTPLDELKSKLP